MLEPDDRLLQTRERLLASAHRVMAGRIDDTLPGAHDDAEAEYAEDELVKAAAAHARAKVAKRLEDAQLHGGPHSALERRIMRLVHSPPDLAARLEETGAEAAVMELALLEIARNPEEVDREEASQIAFDALPEGAGKP